MTLTPVTAATSSYYAGISVFQDESSETSGTISGGSNLNIDGTIYLPEANLTLSGKGSGGTSNPALVQYVALKLPPPGRAMAGMVMVVRS